MAPFPLLVPDHEMANSSLLREIWWCPTYEAITMAFISGVKVELQPNPFEDPVLEWTQDAASYPQASVGIMRGKPASFADPEKDPTGISNGGVSWVEDGLYIIVYGNGEIPLDQLIEVAKSLTRA